MASLLLRCDPSNNLCGIVAVLPATRHLHKPARNSASGLRSTPWPGTGYTFVLSPSTIFLMRKLAGEYLAVQPHFYKIPKSCLFGQGKLDACPPNANMLMLSPYQLLSVNHGAMLPASSPCHPYHILPLMPPI